MQLVHGTLSFIQRHMLLLGQLRSQNASLLRLHNSHARGMQHPPRPGGQSLCYLVHITYD